MPRAEKKSLGQHVAEDAQLGSKALHGKLTLARDRQPTPLLFGIENFCFLADNTQRRFRDYTHSFLKCKKEKKT